MNNETNIILTEEEADELFGTLFCAPEIEFSHTAYANSQQGAFIFTATLTEKALLILKKIQQTLTQRDQCPRVSCMGEIKTFTGNEEDPFRTIYRQCEECGSGFEEIS